MFYFKKRKKMLSENFRWVHLHDYIGFSSSNVIVCNSKVVMPICENAFHDFKKDFKRMKLYHNNILCLDIHGVVNIASNLDSGDLQNIFYSSISQTVMTEPLKLLKRKLPDLICAECKSNPEPIHVYINSDNELTTVAYKKLRLVKCEEVTFPEKSVDRIIEIKVQNIFEGDSCTSNLSIACSKTSAVEILKTIF